MQWCVVPRAFNFSGGAGTAGLQSRVVQLFIYARGRPFCSELRPAPPAPAPPCRKKNPARAAVSLAAPLLFFYSQPFSRHLDLILRSCGGCNCSQGVFCTIQPFWELIEFLYNHAHELGEHGTLRLCLFKSGVLPDPSDSQLSKGSRLKVSLSALAQNNKTIADCATSLLMHVACATSEHEEHVHGIELSFDAEEEAVCTIWYSEAMAKDEEAVSDLREDVAEALNLGSGTGDELVTVCPFDPPPAHAQPMQTRALQNHPNPLLDELQVRVHRTSSSPDTSHSATPQLKRGMLSPPRRRHTAIVLHGLKEELLRNRRKAHNTRRQGRNTTATAARGGPTLGSTGDASEEGQGDRSQMRRRSASLGDTVENGPIEALCVPAIST